MSIDRAFPSFAELLRRRFLRGTYTTEDAVRYTFFAALIEIGVKPEVVVLEHPLPEEGRKKLDVLIEAPPGAALEFKYDREIPSGKNVNRTQRAGSVFKDLARLARFQEGHGGRAFFVYLAGREMAVYFQNQHPELWRLERGQAMAIDEGYIARQSATFRKTVGAPWPPLRLTTRGGWALPQDHALRIWEVERR